MAYAYGRFVMAGFSTHNGRIQLSITYYVSFLFLLCCARASRSATPVGLGAAFCSLEKVLLSSTLKKDTHIQVIDMRSCRLTYGGHCVTERSMGDGHAPRFPAQSRLPSPAPASVVSASRAPFPRPSKISLSAALYVTGVTRIGRGDRCVNAPCWRQAAPCNEPMTQSIPAAMHSSPHASPPTRRTKP